MRAATRGRVGISSRVEMRPESGNLDSLLGLGFGCLLLAAAACGSAELILTVAEAIDAGYYEE